MRPWVIASPMVMLQLNVNYNDVASQVFYGHNYREA
jgi:hypothetical protein